jgi:hypothetical protein
MRSSGVREMTQSWDADKNPADGISLIHNYMECFVHTNLRFTPAKSLFYVVYDMLCGGMWMPVMQEHPVIHRRSSLQSGHQVLQCDVN